MNVNSGGYFMQKGELKCESKFWRLQRLFHLSFLMLLLAPTHNKMMTRMGIARSVVTTAAAMDGESAEAIMDLVGEGGRAAIMGLVGEGGRAAVMDLVGVARTDPAANTMMTTTRAGATSVECVGSSE
jgi:hypothetical protein